jgi:sporulation-control protein
MGDDEHPCRRGDRRHPDHTRPIVLGRDHSLPFRIDLRCTRRWTTIGGHNFVWLRSGLDVPWAVDPGDTDGLEVFPNRAQANVLEAMQTLGFRLYKVDIEPRSSWFGRKWVQEFEFRPVSRGQLRFDEIEMVFESQHGSQVEVLMQVDRAARGLGGFLMELTDTDESWVHAHLDASSPETAACVPAKRAGLTQAASLRNGTGAVGFSTIGRSTFASNSSPSRITLL